MSKISHAIQVAFIILFLNSISSMSIAEETVKIPHDLDEVWNDIKSGIDVLSTDKRATIINQFKEEDLLGLRIQKVRDNEGRIYYHNIQDKIKSMTEDQEQIWMTITATALNQGKKSGDDEGPLQFFKTGCSIVINEKELLGNECVVVEDKNKNFPMVGIYPSQRGTPYFIIWRQLSTREPSGRKADMLYWNGEKAINPNAKIYLGEVAGQYSDEKSTKSVCWNGGKNNICYDNPDRKFSDTKYNESKNNRLFVDESLKTILSEIKCENYLKEYHTNNPSNILQNMFKKLFDDKKNNFSVFYTPDAIACECKLGNVINVAEAYENVLETHHVKKIYNCPKGLLTSTNSSIDGSWKEKFWNWMSKSGPVPEPTEDGLPACALKDNIE